MYPRCGPRRRQSHASPSPQLRGLVPEPYVRAQRPDQSFGCREMSTCSPATLSESSPVELLGWNRAVFLGMQLRGEACVAYLGCCGSKPMGSHFGAFGEFTTHFRIYGGLNRVFTGGTIWLWILTHGHMERGHFHEPLHTSLGRGITKARPLCRGTFSCQGAHLCQVACGISTPAHLGP